MSELTTVQTCARDTRWQLLSTVSSLALAVTFCTAAQAADDASRPTVWIELGAQFDRLQGGETPYMPPFLDTGAPRPFEKVPSAAVQRPSRYSLGGEGKISFRPEGSDWSLAAAVRYGRSSSSKHLHQQTTSTHPAGVNILGTQDIYARLTNFTDTASAHKASYLIADFTAGRDVGLGLWGGNSTTSIDFGVRFAQFTARTATTVRDFPDDYFERIPLPPTFFIQHKYRTEAHHHSYYGQVNATRSFSGIGPTLSVSGSQALGGNVDDGEMTFDWGANAAVLFGRQKVQGNHITTGAYFTNNSGPKSTYNTGRKPFARSRSVVVPNVGGFAGFGAQYNNAKLSFGYRADFFFGAMDGGLDTRKTYDRIFHGPFAKISIGLGG
jgi:hypothetical protein